MMALAPVKSSEKKPAKAAYKEPTVDGFKIKGTLKGSFAEIAKLLRTISFLEVAQEKSAVNVIYIENRDIDKNPYLFSIVKIKKDEIEVLYTIPPEISPRKRRMDVLRYLLNILSLFDKEYDIENKVLYQLIEDAVKEITDSVTMDYSKLYTAYDSLKKKADDLRKKTERLEDQVEALTNQNYELKSENDEVKIRLGELEHLSEETLKTKIQEWIIEHNGSINVSEFSRVYKTPETRVEEILNRLVSEGYIESVS
jgi:regulator of replication initiation timing